MNKIKVLLIGGRCCSVSERTVYEVSGLEQEVKVSYGSGYEHFSYLGQSATVDGETLPVFGWTGNTKVAE